MTLRNRRLLPLTVVAALSLSAGAARAHFILIEPEAATEQNFLGDPQKSPPCGVGDPGNEAVETGIVTTVKSGSTLTIRVNETIFHPGHYRVSIAQTPELLPDDPPVTAGATACGSTEIDTTPELPLLADGLLVHTTGLGGPTNMEVQLPAGFTCDKCTLQVTEFMSDHALNVPGGCYYHHCATLTVNESGLNTDGGVDEPVPTTGCQCGASGGLGVAAIAVLPLFRRRHARLTHQPAETP